MLKLAKVILKNGKLPPVPFISKSQRQFWLFCVNSKKGKLEISISSDVFFGVFMYKGEAPTLTATVSSNNKYRQYRQTTTILKSKELLKKWSVNWVQRGTCDLVNGRKMHSNNFCQKKTKQNSFSIYKEMWRVMALLCLNNTLNACGDSGWSPLRKGCRIWADLHVRPDEYTKLQTVAEHFVPFPLFFLSHRLFQHQDLIVWLLLCFNI